MGRPAKKVEVENAIDVCNYLRGHQDRYYNLGDDNYSKEYLTALKQDKLSNMMREAIGSEYLLHRKPNETEKAVPVLQSFLDLYMSNEDKTRMWKALRKKSNRKNYLSDAFQVTLDGMNEHTFNYIKNDIISNIGLDTDTKYTNTDVIVGLMNFATDIQDSSIRNEILYTIEGGRKFRKLQVYRSSELFKKRSAACISALTTMGLNKEEAKRFTYTVKLAAFNNKTVHELLESKEDKPVPRYLSSLHKLREPEGLYDLPYDEPKRQIYNDLVNWVVLPSDDVKEDQLGLDI